MFVNGSGQKHKLFQFSYCLNSQITDSKTKTNPKFIHLVLQTVFIAYTKVQGQILYTHI